MISEFTKIKFAFKYEQLCRKLYSMIHKVRLKN